MRVRRSVPLDVAVVRAGEGLEADEEGAEFVHELGGLLAEAFLFPALAVISSIFAEAHASVALNAPTIPLSA